MSLRSAIPRIKTAGMNVKGWSTINGFCYDTVIQVLHGYTGKRRIGTTLEIINALKRDGYLTDEDLAA